MNPNRMLILASSFSMALAGTGIAAAQGSIDWEGRGPDIVKSNEWAQVFIRDFYFLNSTYGKGSITNFRQTLYKAYEDEDFPFGWKWEWPRVNVDQVKGYPSISLGQNPWNYYPAASTSENFPARIGAIESMEVEYDVELDIKGMYNLSFDIWVASRPERSDPPEITLTREIMIWVDRKEFEYPKDQFVATVAIDDEKYDFYKMKGFISKGYSRDFLVFIKRKPLLQGRIEIRSFLDYLRERKHIAPDDYIMNIDFGTEIWFGSGEILFNGFEVSVESKP